MAELAKRLYQLLESRTEPVKSGWLVDQLGVRRKEILEIIKKDKQIIRVTNGYILRENYTPSTYKATIK